MATPSLSFHLPDCPPIPRASSRSSPRFIDFPCSVSPVSPFFCPRDSKLSSSDYRPLLARKAARTRWRISCYFEKQADVHSSRKADGHSRNSQESEEVDGNSRYRQEFEGASEVLKASMPSSRSQIEEVGNDHAIAESSTLKARDFTLEIPSLSERHTSADISSQLWEWRQRWFVHYETAGTNNVGAPALLLLPGFGVGSFHYENQLRDLGQRYRVWALDFFGQGRSWPSHDPAPPMNEKSSETESQSWGFGPEVEPWARDLVFSVDLWRDQVLNFVEQVIGDSAYIVGNSLGGFVGVYFTASYPHLVRGITLLNATPFWAFIPNALRSPQFAKLVPWAGELPVPTIARLITRVGWKQLQDPKNILRLLQLVYVDHAVLSDDLLIRILEATDHPAATAAFSSILFAPQGEFSFNEGLQRCRESKVSMCLMYGREDPWVVPLWGQRVKQLVPEALYYEISPAGHCPHHEVPEVVNFLLEGWIESLEFGGFVYPPLHPHFELIDAQPWWNMAYNKEGTSREVQVRVCSKKPSAWAYLVSVFQSMYLKIQTRSL